MIFFYAVNFFQHKFFLNICQFYWLKVENIDFEISSSYAGFSKNHSYYFMLFDQNTFGLLKSSFKVSSQKVL